MIPYGDSLFRYVGTFESECYTGFSPSGLAVEGTRPDRVPVVLRLNSRSLGYPDFPISRARRLRLLSGDPSP